MKAGCRHLIGLLLAGMAAAAPAVPGGAAEGGSVEFAVKAAYLYKAAEFVDWPAASFASADMPVSLCVAGTDPFGAVLDQVVKGQLVGQRAIQVRRLKSVGPNSGCHILFVGGGPDQPVAESLAAVRGSAVLTFTDQAGGPGSAGIVNFLVQGNRVRFDIDDQAAADNGLTISSKLLRLAASVKPRQ